MNKTNFCQKPFSDFDIASFGLPENYREEHTG
jgi:hypothetical protein